MRRVGTPILGKPRPLPGHRRADHLNASYTVNCEEPLIGRSARICRDPRDPSGRAASLRL
jgi:hypothetical protein